MKAGTLTSFNKISLHSLKGSGQFIELQLEINLNSKPQNEQYMVTKKNPNTLQLISGLENEILWTCIPFIDLFSPLWLVQNLLFDQTTIHHDVQM